MRTRFLLVPSSTLIVAASIVTAPAQTPASTVTIFEGARIITGDGRAPLENASFIVSGTRFRQVGSAASRHAAHHPRDEQIREHDKQNDQQLQ